MNRGDAMTMETQTSDLATPPAATTVLDLLLRDRAGLLARIERGDDLAGLARTMIVTIAVAGAAFGAALGVYRGGLQIAYAAIKLPLVVLFTAAIATPVLSALNSALDRPVCLRRDLALVLSSLALGSLVLAGLAPTLFLAARLRVDYHTLILATVCACVVAGTMGVTLLGRGLSRPGSPGRWSVAISLLVVLAMVGAQMSWTLRPYLVRPRTDQPPFLRSLEGNVYAAVFDTALSANGLYHHAYDYESYSTEDRR
jgi:hypothetical protein